ELDEDDEEQLAEEEMLEGLAVDEVAKALHAVFKTHGTLFAPAFHGVVPVAVKYLHERDPAARQWAICVFDDLVEFTGPASSQYAGDFLEPVTQALRDQSAPDLRQAAAYGVGVMAQFGGDAYADFVVSAALPALLEIISRPDAREEDNVYATDNAVSAIAKILRFYGSKLSDARALLQTWFGALPVTHDEDEVPSVYEYLVQVVAEQPDALVPNGDAQMLRHLVKVVVSALAAFDFVPALAQALIALMQNSMQALDASAKAELWAEISPEQQQALQAKGLF
ncbi:importin subunit beta-3, partial [Coemansia sp. RSA 1591]